MWTLVEYSFHRYLGVDLDDVWRVKSGRWFTSKLRGLLSDDTVLAAHFRPTPEQKTEEGP